MTVELIGIEGLPEVRPGDDLAAMLERSLVAVPARERDVLAVTQKVVSKAEGRVVPAVDRAGWIERESVGLVARRGDVVIVRTRHGFVCANAGVDASNVPVGLLTLLPEDPDASAERLQKELCARLGLSRLGVVVTDTFGRPWREGVVDVAIGCAGLPPLVDLRGTRDDRGRALETTVVALADAVAAASGLVMGKAARVPAAIVRGLDTAVLDAPPGPARALVRAPADDLFRESASVAVAATAPVASFGPGAVPRASIEEAVVAASTAVEVPRFLVLTSRTALHRLRAAVEGSGRSDLSHAPAAIVACLPADVSAGAASSLRAGAAIGQLTVALHAQGIDWAWEPERPFDDGRVRAALGLDDDWRPIAIVALGATPEGGAAPRPRPPADPTASGP
jgi:coenzyme F420-0:L-glutamate ligase/coenzyme F420-1:gamma-L-glutamate ligase